MHVLSRLSSRALMVIGLALMLSMTAGCNGEDEQGCETAEDCGEGNWVCTDEGVCQEAGIDLCENVDCPGGQICDEETGDCIGECCQPHTCDHVPGAECVEERCLAGDDPCERVGCDPPCGAGYVCNPETLECEVECLHVGCGSNYPYLRCDPDTGECYQGPIEEGHIGWPCADDPDVCVEGVCDDQFSSDVNNPSGLAFCTANCGDDADCPVGAVCDYGVCWVACDAQYVSDCPFGTQCVTDIGLSTPTCLPFFDLSTCQGPDCLPEHAECDPDATDGCAEGLTCLGWTAGGASCVSLGCHYYNAGCQPGDRCFGIGNNLSMCFQNCDPTDLGSCGSEEGLNTCLPEPRVTEPASVIFYADTEEECAAMGHEAAPNEEDHPFAYTCYVPCSDPCPPGQVCSQGESYQTCVNFDVVDGGCASCGDLDCLTISGQDISICYLACESDADCAEDGHRFGECTRVGLTGGQHIDLCTYPEQGAICLWGCEDDVECGYCESDDDCGTFRWADGETQGQMKCDHASSSCRKPTTADLVQTHCRSFERHDPDGIEDAEGNKTGACAIPCDHDNECFGSICENGFCAAVAETCNLISGQCEPTCDTHDSCFHDACVDGRCLVGCDEHGDCGSLAVCYPDADQDINYCIFPECEDHGDCGDQYCDGGICVDCIEHEDCVDGVCDAGVCVECIEHEDCGEWLCEDGVCVEPPPEPICTVETQGEDCEPEAPYCDPDGNEGLGECVECIEHVDCGEGWLCEGGVCVEEPVVEGCTIETQEADCEDPLFPYCDPALNDDAGECVALCVNDDNCGEGEMCVAGACV